MTRSEYLQFHRYCCDKMVAITAAKNADYSGASKDDFAFANFESVAIFGVNPLHGFITRITDKLARISTFVKKGILQVKDESVEDTLLDLANYCILMAGYIRSQKLSARIPLQNAVTGEAVVARSHFGEEAARREN